MAGVREQRNAVVWAIVWWFARRWLRRRAATIAGRATSTGRGRVVAVVTALGLVAVLAGGLVAWRKLVAREEEPTDLWAAEAGVAAAGPDAGPA